MKIKALLFFLNLAFGCLFASDPSPQKVILIKADDMRNSKLREWERFFELVELKNVRASVGIVCDSLESDKDGYFDWLKGIAASGRIEYWNHGWDHKQWDEKEVKVSEFCKSGYEHQNLALEKSQASAEKALGTPFRCFGAPFNRIDDDTAKVLAKHTEITLVYVYGKPAGYEGKVLLPMNIRGENDGTGKPNFAKFKETYEKSGRNLTIAAVQFHPALFSDDGLQQFAQIIDFLKAEGWIFMTPSEYEEAYTKQSISN